MQFNDDHNPYAPPVAGTVRDEYDDLTMAADRGSRWVARLLDGLLSLVTVVPVGLILLSQDILKVRDLQTPGLATLALWGAALPVSLYQWYLVSTSGQTLGKRWMRIKIVKADGSPVDFVSGVLLREWITAGIGLIPMIGGLINLIGILMIFGDERRCLHDRIAGTRVVQVLRS